MTALVIVIMQQHDDDDDNRDDVLSFSHFFCVSESIGETGASCTKFNYVVFEKFSEI